MSVFLFHLHCAHNVFVKITMVDVVTLCFNEVSCQDNLWEDIAGFIKELCFHGALDVYPLFGGFPIEEDSLFQS